MNDLEAVKLRHSVRNYLAEEIEKSKIDLLEKLVCDVNKASGLKIKLVTNEPKAFGGLMAHYGKFDGVSNYFAIIGKKSKDLDEIAGYYGEKLVLEAQKLGLNTCWVYLTYSKSATKNLLESGEKLVCLISLGAGKTQGTNHKSKPASAVAELTNVPDWFKNGVECALLAPTAMNQQKFKFSLDSEGRVVAKTKAGICTKIDLGIAKRHFEIGAGKENFEWVD